MRTTNPDTRAREPGAQDMPGRDGGTPPQSDTGPREIGGPSGPEPTRYGDWERRGRCIDF